MSRHINADGLKRRLYDLTGAFNSERLHIDAICAEIDDQPDVDVVLCNDCRYSRPWYDPDLPLSVAEVVYCKEHDVYVRRDDFCSWGVDRNE